MFAIYKREMRSYFTTATGYAFLAISLVFSGALIGITSLMQASSDTSVYFTIMLFVLLVLLPILTMKTFSEERKTKTEQIFLTAPIPVYKAVIGKYLSAFTMFIIMMLVSCLNYIPLFVFAVKDSITEMPPSIAMIIGNMFALILIGMAFIAVGIFVSALTENQFASIVITIAVLLGFVLLGTLSEYIGSYGLRMVFGWFSIYGRFVNFTFGMFDFGALFYYLALTSVFVFLTVRVFEARKYR